MSARQAPAPNFVEICPQEACKWMKNMYTQFFLFMYTFLVTHLYIRHISRFLQWWVKRH